MSMWFHGQDIIKPEYGGYLFGQTETWPGHLQLNDRYLSLFKSAIILNML